MTTTLAAADNRRATALVCHYGRANLSGVNTILNEADTKRRVTPLVISVLDLHAGIIPILLTDDGLACLTAMLDDLHETTTDTDQKRAVELITSHNVQDAEKFGTTLAAAGKDDKVSETIEAILAIFRAYVPLLYCELGLTVLQRSIIDWAGREAKEDNE